MTLAHFVYMKSMIYFMLLLTILPFHAVAKSEDEDDNIDNDFIAACAIAW